MLQFLDFDFCILSVNLWKSDNPVSRYCLCIINDLGKFVKIEPIGDGLSRFSKHVGLLPNYKDDTLKYS